jgi:hypothetical protein
MNDELELAAGCDALGLLGRGERLLTAGRDTARSELCVNV